MRYYVGHDVFRMDPTALSREVLRRTLDGKRGPVRPKDTLDGHEITGKILYAQLTLEGSGYLALRMPTALKM